MLKIASNIVLLLLFLLFSILILNLSNYTPNYPWQIISYLCFSIVLLWIVAIYKKLKRYTRMQALAIFFAGLVSTVGILVISQGMILGIVFYMNAVINHDAP